MSLRQSSLFGTRDTVTCRLIVSRSYTSGGSRDSFDGGAQFSLISYIFIYKWYLNKNFLLRDSIYRCRWSYLYVIMTLDMFIQPFKTILDTFIETSKKLLTYIINYSLKIIYFHHTNRNHSIKIVPQPWKTYVNICALFTVTYICNINIRGNRRYLVYLRNNSWQP